MCASSDTDYVMTYYKPANWPQLLARSFPRKENRRVSMTLADFLTAAWKLANDKARELGSARYPSHSQFTLVGATSARQTRIELRCSRTATSRQSQLVLSSARSTDTSIAPNTVNRFRNGTGAGTNHALTN